MLAPRPWPTPLWIFGYGSLLWRPDFPHVEVRPASLAGWSRRFWQGSPDHRGVPGAPGRVVTLVPDAGARCSGLAFRVAGVDAGPVLAALDERESGGFERAEVKLRFEGIPGAEPETEELQLALSYIAGPENSNFLGAAPLEEMARQVRGARGKSGSNREYVLRLAQSLSDLDAPDRHVLALAAKIRAGADAEV